MPLPRLDPTGGTVECKNMFFIRISLSVVSQIISVGIRSSQLRRLC